MNDKNKIINSPIETLKWSQISKTNTQMDGAKTYSQPPHHIHKDTFKALK